MARRKWQVEEDSSSSIKIAFQNHMSLFSIPIVAFLYAVIQLIIGDPLSLQGLFAGIWIMLAIFAAILTGIYSLYNYYGPRWRFSWWKNVLLSLVLFILSSFLFSVIIKATT